MKENGLIIICTAKELTPGKMVENMMENTDMIKSMVMEYIHGQMAVNMKVIGLMENKMVKESTYCLMVQWKWAFGKMEKEVNGLMDQVMPRKLKYIENKKKK
jgi:hypothetical protein